MIVFMCEILLLSDATLEGGVCFVKHAHFW